MNNGVFPSDIHPELLSLLSLSSLRRPLHFFFLWQYNIESVEGCRTTERESSGGGREVRRTAALMALPEEEILIAAVASVSLFSSRPRCHCCRCCHGSPASSPSLPLRNPENDNIAVARLAYLSLRLSDRRCTTLGLNFTG